MSDCEPSREQLIETLASLHQDVAEFQAIKTAFEIQTELLLTLVTTGKTATGALMLRAVLQQILEISSRLTNAEEGSLFLLDPNGRVAESILARGAVIREVKQNLIGRVLDKGLAGWVMRHRQVGLISDTMQDERWLTLPNEPYTVRSALSVPLIRGRVLLGIITLMHSEPGHFSPESAQLMQTNAEQMTLILENAALCVERQLSPSESSKTQEQEASALPKPEEPRSKQEKLSLLGIYIITGDGKFMYTNPGVAKMFGYTFIEFITVESIFEVVAANSRQLVAEQINQCFKAQSQRLLCTFKGQRKDSSLIDVQVYGTRTKLSGKPVLIGVLRSI